MSAPADRSGCASNLLDAQPDLDTWTCSKPDCDLGMDEHDFPLVLEHELGMAPGTADDGAAVILAALGDDESARLLLGAAWS